MGFINSLGQVASNRKKFEEWKEKDADRQEQRIALINKGVSTAELEKAKAKSKVDERNGIIKTLVSTIKDNKEYKKWADSYNPEDKKVQRQLTPEELKAAEKDKELIQRITKTYNNKAEEYSENMEVAAGVLIGGTPFLGAGVSAILNGIFNKTGLEELNDPKYYANEYSNNLSKDLSYRNNHPNISILPAMLSMDDFIKMTK